MNVCDRFQKQDVKGRTLDQQEEYNMAVIPRTIG